MSTNESIGQGEVLHGRGGRSLQIEPPALLIDPNVPRATPKSSGGQLRGARESEAVSITPTDRHAIVINAIPLALSSGPTEVMAAENAVSETVDAIKIHL